MERLDQSEVIKFIRWNFYKKLLEKYSNIYQRRRDAFETMYMWENCPASNEAKYSEIYMHSQRARMLQSKIDDITDNSRGAELVKEMLSEQIINVKSHFQGLTNSLGMSKDVAIFTEDDKNKHKMSHELNMHLFIIGLMNPTKQGEDGLTESQKQAIYESPEDTIEKASWDDVIEV